MSGNDYYSALGSPVSLVTHSAEKGTSANQQLYTQVDVTTG